MKVESWGDSRVLIVGEVEIWDGEDLHLLRETIRQLVEDEGCHSLGVDMSHVKYIPSGFFGTLCDWHEKGVCVRLFYPLSHVQQMFWFLKFFRNIGNNCHELRIEVDSEDEEPASELASTYE